MSPEQQQELNACVQRLAEILYQDAQAQGLPMGTLVEIESTVRQQLLSQVSPNLGVFLSTKSVPPNRVRMSGR